MDHVVSAATALTPDGRLRPYWLRIGDGMILDAGEGTPPCAPDLHFPEGVLAPGFIDVHAHGGGGASFTEGVEQARAVLAAHRARGTTTMLASLVSAPVPDLLAQTEALRPLVHAGELAGVHWEGPWLSLEHRGAHDERALDHPTASQVSSVLEHPAGELIRYVTLAPELPGAIEAVQRLVTAGTAVGLGHSGATSTQTRAALAVGASVATHLFNAMRGLHHREPGPVLPLLEDPQVHLELISDGVHLHPEIINWAWETAARRGGAQRIVLVSDAMAAAGAPDGDYTLGSLAVRVRDGIARLATDGDAPGAIAGSTLTLSTAVRYSILHAQVPAERALLAATTNPARMVGLTDVGRLAAGNRADLVLLDSQWRVRKVMHGGRWVG